MAVRTPLLIADVERATGIARATLRVWEQRYGFPVPGRGVNGQRTYPSSQVEKLRLIQQLIRGGQRPGRVVPLTKAELGALAKHNVRAAPIAEDPVLRLMREHDYDRLLQLLRHMSAELGLRQFITRLISIGKLVGEAWEKGQMAVFEIDAYVEAAQTVLRQAILFLPTVAAMARPRVLLATVGEEAHSLALLMSQGIFALEGCACVPLGVQIPVAEVAAAVAGYRIDIVALSFSAAANSRRVIADLKQLREQLPNQVEIWAGGSSTILSRQPVMGVRAFSSIDQIGPAVAKRREDMFDVL